VFIDSHHRLWIYVTVGVSVLAVAIYTLCDYRTPGGLSGASTVGLWYGTIGTALILASWALTLHRRLPSRPLFGRRSTWLRAHLWLGTLSGIFLVCHAHYRLGGWLTTTLALTTGLVLVSGWLGVVLQMLLPRLMAAQLTVEAPYDQLPYLIQVVRRKADRLVDEVCGPVADKQASMDSIAMTRAAAQFAASFNVQLRAFYEHDIRPFLTVTPPRRSPMRSSTRAEVRFSKLLQLDTLDEHGARVQELRTLCDQRRQLLTQARLQFWLHSWLVLHIPAAVAVLVLGVAHIVTALYY
jgi:hypothetical protein